MHLEEIINISRPRLPRTSMSSQRMHKFLTNIIHPRIIPCNVGMSPPQTCRLTPDRFDDPSTPHQHVSRKRGQSQGGGWEKEYVRYDELCNRRMPYQRETLDLNNCLNRSTRDAVEDTTRTHVQTCKTVHSEF